jgi:hypothetical protein
MDPEAVLAAVHGSDRLGRLHSRIWRPLDRTSVPRLAGEHAASDDAQPAADDSDH